VRVCTGDVSFMLRQTALVAAQMDLFAYPCGLEAWTTSWVLKGVFV
jgi:hypothetical protein